MDAIKLPLCVDLDGTLIEGDASWMSVRTLFKRSPFTAVSLLPLFFVDRAKFKHELSRRYVPASVAAVAKKRFVIEREFA